jgi:hypothetical protein
MSDDGVDDLTDDERRVVRWALAQLAAAHEDTVRGWDELNAARGLTPETQPMTGVRKTVEQDIRTARRLIRERFQPEGEGGAA